MRKILLASAVALGLGGCVFDDALRTLDVAAGASVPVSAVVVAVNTFDALEATATQYVSLPKCTGANSPVCRTPTITKGVIKAVRSGRVARDNLEAYLAANPGKLGPTGLYNALTSAVSTLQSIIAQNR